jgi:hypothetical protein
LPDDLLQHKEDSHRRHIAVPAQDLPGVAQVSRLQFEGLAQVIDDFGPTGMNPPQVDIAD